MKNIIVAALCIGVVDVIERNHALVEITQDGAPVTEAVFPLSIFPCEVQEGSMFYFEYVEGVTEIRCGEPPQ
jgi:hypothetical protein